MSCGRELLTCAHLAVVALCAGLLVGCPGEWLLPSSCCRSRLLNTSKPGQSIHR